MNKWLVILLVVASCKNKLPETGYKDFINDPANKIFQKIKVGGVEASVKWMPVAFNRLAGRESGTSGSTTDGYYYFNAKFEKMGGEKPPKAKLMYLDFDMQKDFVLLMGKDSTAPTICQKIENGVSGSYEYMLAFDGNGSMPGDDDFTVIYNDKIFGIGTISFVYNSADIKRIPKLKDKIQDEVSYKP